MVIPQQNVQSLVRLMSVLLLLISSYQNVTFIFY